MLLQSRIPRPESDNIHCMEQQLLADNIAKLQQRVGLSAQKCHRNPRDIRLLAVSKNRPAGDIRLAYECGLGEFGESYLQEALVKITELQDLDLVWHFIGPIQSNKTRQIAQHFSWVHSVDRIKTARRLSEQRPAHLPPLQVCLQVNISGESSKSGADPEQLPQLVREITALPRLQLRGLMAIPAATSDTRQQRQPFGRLRATLEELQATAPGMDTLSMGMSADLEAAIAEGATIVRIGTDLFGPRNR